MFQPISAFDNDKGAVDMAKAYAAMQNVFGFSDSTQSAQAAEHTSVEADGIPTESGRRFPRKWKEFPRKRRK